MTKNRIVKYVANTALLAVLAAAGIGAYQIGTYTPEKKLQEEIPSDAEKDSEEISMVDVDASLVDSEISDTMQNKNTEEDGTVTVTIFLLSSPNPTTGLVFFCPEKDVEYIDMTPEKAFSKIISLGMK